MRIDFHKSVRTADLSCSAQKYKSNDTAYSGEQATTKEVFKTFTRLRHYY